MINLKQDDVECYNLKNRADRLNELAQCIGSTIHNIEISISMEEMNSIDRAFDIVLIHLGRVDRLLNKRFNKLREQQID